MGVEGRSPKRWFAITVAFSGRGGNDPASACLERRWVLVSSVVLFPSVWLGGKTLVALHSTLFFNPGPFIARVVRLVGHALRADCW
jgi:hypothetical protein